MLRALSISLLGSFSVLLAGKPVHALETPRMRTLLAYLILHRHTSIYRESLADALWPDLTERESRSNLRKLLYRLNQGLPDVDRCVEITHARIGWRPDAAVELDVQELEHLCAAPPTLANLQQAAALYRGDLLEGCDELWILPERERFRRLLMGQLEGGAKLLEDTRQYAAALQLAQHLVTLDPLNEWAYLRELRLHIACGDKAAALRTYRTCVSTLERELDEPCPPELVQEFERLLGSGPNRPSPASGPLPLVGRHQEWRALCDAWKGTVGGKPLLVLLKAEAGRGKTRLAQELLKWVEQQGHMAAMVRCHETGTELAFSALAELLRPQPLTELAPVWLTELTRLLPELAESHPDLPAPRPMVEPWQQLRFFQAITRAFSLRQPMLLVIDDVHWSDPYSLKWLHQLYSQGSAPRIMTVLTLRSGEDFPAEYLLTRLLPSLERSGHLLELPLPPMEPEFVLELARLEVGSPLEATQAAVLVRESVGNPLFALELLRGHYLDQVAEVTLEQAPIPPTLRSLILSKVRSLSPAANQVLQLCAVTGSRFSLALLSRVLTDEPRSLVEGLESLVHRGLIRETDGQTYEFTHPRLHDIIYGELSNARRGLLHRLVAETLAMMSRQVAVQRPQQVSYHFEKAGLPLEAVPFLIQAAEAAWRILDSEEAIRLYSRALSQLEGYAAHELVWKALLGREKVLGLLGRSALREADQRALAILLERHPDDNRQALLLSRQAQLDTLRGHIELAETRARRALEGVRAAGDQRLELELLHLLLEIAQRQGERALELDYAEQALAIAQRLHDPVEEIMALAEISSARASLHHHEQAIAAGKKAVQLAEATRDPRLESMATGSLAHAFDCARRLSEAVPLYSRSVSAARTCQDRALELQYTGSLGSVHYALRQFPDALRAYDRVERLNELLNDGVTPVLLRFHKASLLGTLGHYPRAFALFEEGLELAAQRGLRYNQIELSLRYANFLNEAGEWQRAASWAQRGLEFEDGRVWKSHQFGVMLRAGLKRNLGVSLIGQGQVQEGMALLESVLAEVQSGVFPAVHHLLTYTFLADASLKIGDWERFLAPLKALLPVTWGTLMRPELVYLTCYRLHRAAGLSSSAREYLQQGAVLLGETTSRLELPDDVHSYLRVVPPNRQLFDALIAEGLVPGDLPAPGKSLLPSTSLLTHTSPGH